MPFDVYLNVAIGGVLTGLVYGLMALGLSVIFGVVRVVNFAHGEMMTIAMFIAVVLCTGLHLDPLILLVPIAAVMFVFGYVLQRGLINLVRHPARAFAVSAAGGAGAHHRQRAADRLRSGRAIGADGLWLRKFPDRPDDRRRRQGLCRRRRHRRRPPRCSRSSASRCVGKAIRACADNHTGALVVGLDVKRLYALTFGIGAACVGAAGTMLVLLVDATPMLGPSYTLLAFVIVITGGLGSMPGALVGGVLIGVTEALAGLLFTPSIKSMFAFGILVLVLLFRPQGILGRTAA